MVLTVLSKSVKQAFQDISPILRKSDTSKSVAFSVEDNKLFITAESSGILYQSEIVIKSSINYVETTLTVWYEGVEEFLSARGDVEIEISPVAVTITTEDFYKSLLASNSVISKFSGHSLGDSNFELEKLEFSIKKLTASSILQKTLQMDKPLLFFGDYALLKYPVVWIKVKSSGIHSALSAEHAKCILNFQPTHIRESDVIEFRKETAILLLPVTQTSDDKSFETIVSQMKSVTKMGTDGLFGIIQKINRAVGSEQCKCYVYTQGIEIEVIKSTSKLSKRINCVGQQLTSFSVPIDYLLMSFNLLGDLGVEVLAGGGKICLRNSLVSILMSVA